MILNDCISYTEFYIATVLVPFYCLVGFCHLLSRHLNVIKCPGSFWVLGTIAKLRKLTVSFFRLFCLSS
jgi:hypothetical protein